MSWTWGYGTNGFTDHPLPAALDVLQHHGYGAVALTLGHPHLDPFAADWRAQTQALAADLRRRGLRVVVETGARYLLDPLRKHRPTLVDREAGSRMAFLRRAIEIAAVLDADCVSLWSGVVPDDVSVDQARVLLEERLLELTAFAADASVTLALEPEPGMLVETVADALALRARLGHPANLGLTVDLGHCVVVEPAGVVGALRAAGGLLRNVQADDMLPAAHEHLPFGEGELDLDAALSTLREIDYAGVIAVELPRHAHAAPELARASMAALVAAAERTATAGAAGGGDSAGEGPRSSAESSAARISSAPGAGPAGAVGGGVSAGGGPRSLAESSAARISSAPGAGPAGAAGEGIRPGRAPVLRRALRPRNLLRSRTRGPAGTPLDHPRHRADTDGCHPRPAPVRLGGARGGARPLSAEPFAPTADDAARAAIIATLADSGADPAVAVALYRRGDDAERRGVLRGLDALAAPAAAWREAGLELVVDALRANDTRLVAAALGTFAAEHLDDHAWRHGVLKCVFLGIPLSVVSGLEVRADDELAAMAERFAAERRAAGRPVPDDLLLLRARERA
ncbi:EboA domain-containing protein [Microbacterium testaceum]|uniref:EboA domain-containing protein n=1 Tax=Microbacterium testaceum TaxID=2033 RepID=UPI0025AF94FE|nr:EboA domain-containing protein [Microbacterium testaceum]WJS90562.1 EboA domain-containing protein [Microbacterium testaceum]